VRILDEMSMTKAPHGKPLDDSDGDARKGGICYTDLVSN